jgi:hypothetical protein
MGASLQDYLRTGRFGSLGLGASESDVQAQLGPPPDHAAASWTYGDLQVVFEEGVVHSLVLLPPEGQAPAAGDLLALDPWIIQARLGLETTRAALTAAGIGFEEGDDPQNPGARLLVTDGDVALIFCVDPAKTALPPGLFMLVCTRS